MWILKNGKLIHTTDETRVSFRTNLCASILSDLRCLSEKYNTYTNYLLETGFTKFLESCAIDYNKMPRVDPKNRTLYVTTYDSNLIKAIKEVARQEFIHTNQLIEYCSQFVDVSEVKSANHRYRVEKE